MQNARLMSVTFTGLLAIVCILSGARAGQTSASSVEPSDQVKGAREILDATGTKGGLIVHIGCGDGKLTAALHANDSYLVHGLDKDAESVERAREYIRSVGLYGSVSVEQWTQKHLPYTDNLANLIVAEDLGQIKLDEVMRVLCPRGVAYVKTGDEWTKTVKPWPDDIDEWTHFLHDASNNAVAGDMQVGPPRRLKWVCGPLWSRSHEFNSSLCAMVSAKGRLFYVFDEGLTGVTPESIPEKWILIARDAFNGMLLWKRPLAKWTSREWKNRGLRNVPQTVPRRLVADGDRLFMTLGYDGPVSVLDAATGRILTTYEGTEGTEEIRCIQGILILRKGKNFVMAINTKTGEKLWEATENISPLSLAAQNGRIFYQGDQMLICRRVNDGEQMWRVPSKTPVSLLMVHGDCVLLLGRKGIRALSVDTGRTIWTAEQPANRQELFIANDRAWHWVGQSFVGRDLRSGQVTTSLNTDDVFTQGHHLRCYQSKATENFIITPNRGIEFISLTGGVNTQNDWVRGPCRYGIMPCNGLLYVPPNPCFCYPGVKLTGFNALAPAQAVQKSEMEPNFAERSQNGNPIRSQKSERLEKGSAYYDIRNTRYEIRDNDWPTYRHDARRTGATVCEVPAQVSTQWNVRLRGRLTPPVVAQNRVYVAAKDEHTLYTFGVEDGRRLWCYTAGGRIDSPPTIYGELVLFGSADGRVYCLRASDGKLLWRFRAAPSSHRIIAFDRLESPWRVHGSVLVKDGVVYCTAGRSTYLDGGIRVFGLDPGTGKVVHQTCLDTWARTRKDAENKPFIPAYHIEGSHSDILVSEGDYIYLGQFKLDGTLAEQEVPYVMPGHEDKSKAMSLKELINQPYVGNLKSQLKDEKVQHDWQWRVQKRMMEEYTKKYGGASMGDRKMGRHVFSTSGFLDDSWFNRTFWMYSETWPGFHIAHLGAKTGQLLSVGDTKTYAVQAYPTRNLQSPLFTPGKNGYLLFADDNDNEPVIPDYTRGVPKGVGFTRSQPPEWFKWVPVRIRGMVLAGRHLFVAGPPDVVDIDDPMAAFEGRKGAVLRAHWAADGNLLAEHKLDAPPVFDGLIAANGQLYLSLEDGTVLCMGPDR